jgi:hypothetical protein
LTDFCESFDEGRACVLKAAFLSLNEGFLQQQKVQRREFIDKKRTIFTRVYCVQVEWDHNDDREPHEKNVTNLQAAAHGRKGQSGRLTRQQQRAGGGGSESRAKPIHLPGACFGLVVLDEELKNRLEVDRLVGKEFDCRAREGGRPRESGF